MIQLLDMSGFLGMRIESYLILFCISISTYFIISIFFKSNNPNTTQKYAIGLASAILIIPLLYAAFTSLLLKSISSEPASTFNQSKWLEDKAGRFAMGDDIVTSKLLLDKDSIQVKKLLGVPNSKDSSSSFWIYEMGTGGGRLGFSIHHLSVRFDKNKVEKVEHLRIKD